MNFPKINFSTNNIYLSLNHLYLQLTPLQKKVSWIGLAIIGMIAAACCYYMIARCLRGKKIVVEEDSEIPDLPISPKTPQKPESPIHCTSPLEPKTQDEEVFDDNENIKDETQEMKETEEMDGEDDEEFFDAQDHWNDESISEEESPQTQRDQKCNHSKAPLSPKDEMISTFQTIWKHASEGEQACISKIWNTMFQTAEIVSWKKSADNSNEYQLTLKTDLQGSHSLLPLIAKAVLKKQIKVTFIEEKILGTQEYRQVIVIGEGIYCRLGIGWLAKKIALENIAIQDNKELGIFCTLQAKGRKPFTLLADEALEIWQGVKWDK